LIIITVVDFVVCTIIGSCKKYWIYLDRRSIRRCK